MVARTCGNGRSRPHDPEHADWVLSSSRVPDRLEVRLDASGQVLAFRRVPDQYAEAPRHPRNVNRPLEANRHEHSSGDVEQGT